MVLSVHSRLSAVQSDERRQQAERDPGEVARAAAGKGADDHPANAIHQIAMPDLIVDERVVAAPLQAEVDDQAEAEQPGRRGGRVDAANMLQKRGTSPHRGRVHRVLCYECGPDGHVAISAISLDLRSANG